MAELKLIVGKMGGGKTYTAVEEIIRCLREGGYAHSNIPMDLDYLEENGWLDRYIQIPDDASSLVKENPREMNEDGTYKKKTFHAPWIRMGREGQENILVIDEAAIQFDTDTYTTEKQRQAPLKNLIALTRHLGLDIFMVSQSQTGIAPAFRKLSKQTIHCTNVAKMEGLGWLLVKIPWYGDLRRVYYTEQETEPSFSSWHRWDQEIFAAYNTHGHRGDVNAVEGATRNKSENQNTTRVKNKSKAIMWAFIIAGVLSTGLAQHLYAKYSSPQTENTVNSITQERPKNEQISPPEEKKEIPQTKKTTFAEWNPETDEFILTCVIRDTRGVKINLIDGRNISVGKVFDGEMIETFVKYGDVYYFRTFGQTRWIVVRPITLKERMERIAIPQKERETKSITDMLKGKI